MAWINLQFAWLWFFGGAVSGAVQGLFFHREAWLGGYGSWGRRLARLGHIAFFGTGLLNLSFALSVVALPLHSSSLVSTGSILLLIGGATMPVACYLAAWRKPLRHLFPVPVLALSGGIGVTALATLGQAG